MSDKQQPSSQNRANSEDHLSQIQQRQEKLQHIRDNQAVAFPNDFRRNALAAELHAQHDQSSPEQLAALTRPILLAGRIMTRRIMGKASFIHLQDQSGKMQIYIARDELEEGQYAIFKQWDLGDIIGVEGQLFITKTGELSIRARQLQLLTKALRPLPDKFHGLTDIEQRYRQRYLDLISNESVRQLFTTRSQIISGIRHFLSDQGFLEVETPMLHPLIGGAAARPFITHHNALDMELYLRIAPELYLKRLVVGGLEKVFEINRNFRNEGVSTRHNPEFTMLEFYQAYADYNDLMNLTEKLFHYLATSVLKKESIVWQGNDIDLSKPFARISMRDAICQHVPQVSPDQLMDVDVAKKICAEHNITLHPNWGLGKIHMALFEERVEHHLIQPTFITQFPAEVSPLSRLNDDNPFFADRFELYAAKIEIANGFSELNDAQDQARRFQDQLKAKEAGEDETMSYDADYITALEHGLPPTAGEGIGIDRLLMLLTDAPSIRDVILFPLMRQHAT